MKPTCFAVINDSYFSDNYPEAPLDIPRGVLFQISVNPFNGQMIFTFQRSSIAVDLITHALDSIEFHHGSFDNLAEETIKNEPRYLLRSVS